jgi:hypothetical protein
MSKKRAQRLLEALLAFFLDEASPFLNHRDARARFWKAFVSLDRDLAPHYNSLRSVDYLVQNTWGEMFFYSLDLGHIENDLLKCYEIAKRLWQYVQGAVPGESAYRIHEGSTIGDSATTRAIEDFIQSFRESDGWGPEDQDGNRLPGTASKRQQRAPMIDLL